MTGHDTPPPRHFFGYGSLVNRATHSYPAAHPALLQGWRRVWVHTTVRPVAYLSVRCDATCDIDGLLAEVPGGDWAALDDREHAYIRHPVRAQLTGLGAVAAQVYAVPPDHAQDPQTAHPILLSYLDTVVQGFVREFGQSGAERFFATTDGWQAPMLDDRAAPRYPQAQVLSGAETRLVDRLLVSVGAQVFTDNTPAP